MPAYAFLYDDLIDKTMYRLAETRHLGCKDEFMIIHTKIYADGKKIEAPIHIAKILNDDDSLFKNRKKDDNGNFTQSKLQCIESQNFEDAAVYKIIPIIVSASSKYTAEIEADKLFAEQFPSAIRHRALRPSSIELPEFANDDEKLKFIKRVFEEDLDNESGRGEQVYYSTESMQEAVIKITGLEAGVAEKVIADWIKITDEKGDNWKLFEYLESA